MPIELLIVLGVVAVVIVIGVIIFILKRNENKPTSNVLLNDKELIGKIVTELAVIKNRLSEYPELSKKAEDLYDKLDHTSPSSSQEVFNYDTKIHNKAGDLKIATTKINPEKGFTNITNILDEIEELYIYRSNSAKQFKNK